MSSSGIGIPAPKLHLLLPLVLCALTPQAFIHSPRGGTASQLPPFRRGPCIAPRSSGQPNGAKKKPSTGARNALRCGHGKQTPPSARLSLSNSRSSSSSSSSKSCQRCSNGGGGDGSTNGEDSGTSLSITTFNVLAPIFKRVGTGRESEHRDMYIERHKAIIEHLKGIGSDVICLQELWIAEQEMVDMYQRSLSGYRMFALPRTEARGDGVACFVREGVDVLDKQDLRLKGLGGRVALVLRLSVGGGAAGVKRREVLVANTHLLFPHARTFEILRIRELRKLLAFLECYTQTNDLTHLPVVLCGDFNGITSGRVYQHLADRGFRCSYEDTLGPGGDCSRWITHVNHRGEELGVDYIWYRNPDPRLEPMEPAWERIVYQSTKKQLLDSYSEAGGARESPVKVADAAAAASAGGGAAVAEEGLEGAGPTSVEGVDIEKNRLSAACQLLGLSEGFELNEEELKLLLDSSGDNFDFLVPLVLDGSSTGLEGASASGGANASPEASGSTLETLSSHIWPPSLEQGLWPADYDMSDHGSLTASFRVAPATDRASNEISGRNSQGDNYATEFGRDVAISAAAAAAAAAGAAAQAAAEAAVEAAGDDDGHYGLR